MVLVVFFGAFLPSTLHSQVAGRDCYVYLSCETHYGVLTMGFAKSIFLKKTFHGAIIFQVVDVLKKPLPPNHRCFAVEGTQAHFPSEGKMGAGMWLQYYLVPCLVLQGIPQQDTKES